MSEGYDVTQIGEGWSKMVHRSLSVKRCANGYIVEYQIPAKENVFNKTISERKVFITNTDMLEFVEEYFAGEPRP